MLVAEGLSLSFREPGGARFVALDVARFAPAPGAVTVVRGPSGSGKSTLLYALAGLLKPERGTVSVDGQSIYALGEGRRDAWRRKTVGFVFQDFHLVPELSPLANVTLARTFSRTRRDLAARGRALLEELGVPIARRSTEVLSRGERQRVAIARALLFDPPIVLADEPTASLDGEAARGVIGIFRKLAADERTVVIASHDPEVIAAGEAELVLAHGRAAGRPAIAA